MIPSHSISHQPMPPAGRPRTAANNDLPPGMIRRIRGGSTRYYYQHPDGSQPPLGGDFNEALKKWTAIRTAPAIKSPDAFTSVAAEFEQHGMLGKSPKTQKEYSAALKRLCAVFKDAPLSSIRPMHVGQLMHELRDTPFQANRIKATLSRMWNWSRSRGLTDLPNPCAGIDGFSEAARKNIVTPEMFWAIYDRADQVLRDWMRLDITIAQRVTDITRIEITDIVTDTSGQRALRYRSTKTGTLGLMVIEGDLLQLLDELKSRKRKAIGRYLLQTDEGQRVTYAMLRNRYDAARDIARAELGDAFRDWQMRDLRKTSLDQATTLEEARRRALHNDPRTTARHYEVRVDSVPGSIPKKPELLTATDELLTNDDSKSVSN